jgi:hypothetical protein
MLPHPMGRGGALHRRAWREAQASPRITEAVQSLFRSDSIGTGLLAFCFDAFSSREPVPIPDQVRDRLSLENPLTTNQKGTKTVIKPIALRVVHDFRAPWDVRDDGRA